MDREVIERKARLSRMKKAVRHSGTSPSTATRRSTGTSCTASPASTSWTFRSSRRPFRSSAFKAQGLKASDPRLNMDKNARIFVTGHRGMVGSAIVRRLQAGGYHNLLLRTHAELDLLDQRAVFDFLARAAAAVHLHRRRQGRWHPGQQPVPRRLPVPEPGHRGQPDPRRASGRRAAPDVPGLELHLPARLPATDQGGVPADRPAGGHQRALRHCQDRRREAVRKLPAAIRSAVHQRDADQPVRAERQLRPGQQPCAAGAAAQGARGQAARRRRVRGLGQRHAAPRVPVRRRPGRCLRVPDGNGLRRALAQRGHRRGRDDPRSWPRR